MSRGDLSIYGLKSDGSNRDNYEKFETYSDYVEDGQSKQISGHHDNFNERAYYIASNNSTNNDYISNNNQHIYARSPSSTSSPLNLSSEPVENDSFLMGSHQRVHHRPTASRNNNTLSTPMFPPPLPQYSPRLSPVHHPNNNSPTFRPPPSPKLFPRGSSLKGNEGNDNNDVFPITSRDHRSLPATTNRQRPQHINHRSNTHDGQIQFLPPLQLINSQILPKSDETPSSPFDVIDLINEYSEINDGSEKTENPNIDKTRSSQEAKNRKRDAAVTEILTTERTYVNGLRKLVNCFLIPLRENYKSAQRSILSTKPLATYEEIASLFGNIESLLSFHELLLRYLEERYQKWSSTEKISDIFLQNAPYLKMYSAYLKGFPQSIATMERLNQERDFKKFIQLCQAKPELGNLPFNSFLSLPIQRIPRYKLLLEALLKHTENTHPDYINLKQCVQQISLIAEEVNEKIRDAENQQKVLEIQNKVERLPDNIIDPARRFIYQGDLYKVTQRMSPMKPYFIATEDRRAHFLFNDLLLLCIEFQGKLLYTGQINLNNAYLIDIDDNDADQPFCFQLITTTTEGKEACHTVRATTAEEKMEWITRIDTALKVLKRGIRNNPGIK
ncbi:Dbl-likey domain-containing protein [Gigaspora margarita]|uniref:Dbl-likey domain-containing protein n=1 Tax=Gigaspora margarita TaxID=4874 RepID=A0A8H3XDZ7_GIGMA|nr:Dbl-likey domain-containing protein [Gigaspora margarita]